jgi:phosphatidylinositol alpha-1,6-mannosyltransferase
MKVALLGPVWGTHGGWSRVVEKMTPLLARKADITLYLPINSPRYKSACYFSVKYILPPISYHPLHPKVIQYTLRFLHDLMREDYEIIQTYEAWPLSFLGGLASLILKIPLFVGAHGTAAINPLFNPRTRASLIWSYKISRKILCISSYTKKILETLTGLSKFIVQPLDGVDYDFFARPRDLVNLENIWRPGKIILTVGKLKERKGIDISLLAFKFVKEKIHDAKYIIIGGGNRTFYQTLVSKMNLRDVYFLGEVTDEELAKYYQLCDVFVLTPKRVDFDVEGFGLVYLEAGAAGKPVVASNHGGVRDVVKHMINGIIVPENDPRETSRALISILTDEKLARKLGENGREIARRFSWENSVNSLISLWKAYLTGDQL